MTVNDSVWQSAAVTRFFLDGVRGAIPLAAEQIDVMLRVIRAAKPDTRNFLDLGCGSGVLGHALLTAFPAAHGVFLDFSAPMLDAARQNLNAAASRISFIQCDYGQPDWVVAVEAHAPFDAIVSGFSIHHQPDARKQQLYQDIFTLLQPGGVFLNLEHVAPQSAWAEGLFDELMIDGMFAHSQRTNDGKSRDEVAAAFHSREDKAANILALVETQCTWLRDIGFVEVDCYLKIFELALFGGIKPA
ncbi:MAG: methyltransferase type 12 [Anaerolineaceae bacterium]|nr:methyltransferase type 12 [Anaerolineaceae bacterium]